MMKTLILVAVLGMVAPAYPAAELNQLAASEQAAGWKLLFDGHSAEHWRGYKKDSFPVQGWKVDGGLLKKIGGEQGGDIVTRQEFEDYDLRWEWRITPGGNNGVKYLVTEKRAGAPGHEYQMIDDEGHPDGKLGPKRQTASFYDVLPPSADRKLNKPGEWNSSRVLVQGHHVEHWLNGAKVLAYELGSDAVMDAVRQSKFKNQAGFGTKIKGRILLTDHADECWFRNLKILELPKK